MDPKVFVVCLLLVGCVPTPPPPPVISKEVVAKVHIQESGTDIDMWAFAMDNKLRSVPTIYEEYDQWNLGYKIASDCHEASNRREQHEYHQRRFSSY